MAAPFTQLHHDSERFMTLLYNGVCHCATPQLSTIQRYIFSTLFQLLLEIKLICPMEHWGQVTQGYYLCLVARVRFTPWKNVRVKLAMLSYVSRCMDISHINVNKQYIFSFHSLLLSYTFGSKIQRYPPDLHYLYIFSTCCMLEMALLMLSNKKSHGHRRRKSCFSLSNDKILRCCSICTVIMAAAFLTMANYSVTQKECFKYALHWNQYLFCSTVVLTAYTIFVRCISFETFKLDNK